MDNALGQPQTIVLLGGTSDIGLAIVRQLLSPATRTVVLACRDLERGERAAAGLRHHSVAIEAPDVWRLHLVGEPAIADKIRAARHAHARIDDWASAQGWIMEQLDAGVAPPVLDSVTGD